MSSQFCYHSFNPEEHNGKTWMVCAKCGLRNPLGLFQHWDTERDGTPVFAKYSDSTGPGRNIKKGRSSGPHLQWVKNTTGKIEDIITREEWDKANPPLRPDSSYGANYAQRRYGPNRSPIVKVRREILSNSYGTLTRWNWRCNICGLGRAQSGWWIAMDTADQHARNHHRSGK